MNPRESLFFAVLVLLIGGAAFLILGGEGASPQEAASLSPNLEPSKQESGLSLAAQLRTKDLVSLESADREDAGPEMSTVLWPLEVRLELIESKDAPTNERVGRTASPGAGATARLVGRIGSKVDRGAQAEIHFIAGANEGRVLITDSEGRFGATDLYPGLSIVDISGPGLVGARRELRLRQRREAALNIGFGRPGAVQGQVFSEAEELIEGALVRVDGHEDFTDAEGHFYIGGLASGLSFIEIERAGFAGHREMINIVTNATVPAGRLKYLLKPSGTLVLTAKGNVGGPGPIEVWLNSGDPRRLSGFPYWRLNPILLQPGEQREITDLPREVVRVQAWRTGAKCNPPSRNVNLRSSLRMPLTIELRSQEKIVGRIFQDGKPVIAAQVTLEAPDQVQAALRHYRKPAAFLESGYLPFGPNAIQVVQTDGLGRFVLSAWDDGSPARYITAKSKNGKYIAKRLLDGTDRDISLDLHPAKSGAGVLVLDLSDRFQGLPIMWYTNGAPGPPRILPHDENLEFAGLREGTWSVEVKWSAETLLATQSVEVTTQGKSLSVTLPDDAITGQDREAWLRAGREYPY